MPTSFVSVDYDKIKQLFKKRGTTRSKCAKACNIHPATLGNAFSRNSRMRVDYLKAIADFLEVKPQELILKDEHGNPMHAKDWEAVFSKDNYSGYDREMDEIMSDSMRDLYIDLNQEGREILYSTSREVSDLLHQIPKYLIDAPESEE